MGDASASGPPSPAVSALAVAGGAGDQALYAGGNFTSLGVLNEGYIARWDCSPATCAADLDGNAVVDVFDLLAYLDLWFASDAAAELTGDDPASIDVFDLLSYLDSWFAGC